MSSKHYKELPKKVIIGDDVINELGKVIKELRLGNRIFIVTGPTVKTLVTDDVYSKLCNEGFNVELAVVRKPTIDEAEGVLPLVSDYKANVVVGIGGGKSIDIAKYVATKLGIPYVSVPTAASHDGVASPFVSLRGSGRVTSVKAKPPLAIVADIKIISRAPKRLLRAGASDLSREVHSCT